MSKNGRRDQTIELFRIDNRQAFSRSHDAKRIHSRDRFDLGREDHRSSRCRLSSWHTPRKRRFFLIKSPRNQRSDGNRSGRSVIDVNRCRKPALRQDSHSFRRTTVSIKRMIPSTEGPIAVTDRRKTGAGTPGKGVGEIYRADDNCCTRDCSSDSRDLLISALTTSFRLSNMRRI